VQNSTTYDDTVSWDEMKAKPGVYKCVGDSGLFIVGGLSPILYTLDSGLGSLITAHERTGRFRRLRDNNSLNDIIACMGKK